MKRDEFIESIPNLLEETLRSLLIKAYDEGFNAGTESSLKEDSLEEQEIKWVNLELPSGNLWHFEKIGAYPKEDTMLPTEDDIQELLHGTLNADTYSGYLNGIMVKGLNGNNFSVVSMYNTSANVNRDIYIWVKSDLESDMSHKVVKLTHSALQKKIGTYISWDYNVMNRGFDNLYAGESATILFCKHPN